MNPTVDLRSDTLTQPTEAMRKAMAIASDICVFTNGNLTVETLDG